MASFDFFCRVHGHFEELFCAPQTKEYPCPHCGKPAEQIWLKCPNIDSTAFSFWNNTHDPEVGTFSDKSRYRESLKRSGSTIYESGMDKDAEENGKRICQKQMSAFREKLDRWIGEHTIDEVQKMVAVDKQIYDAQVRGDANAIKAMGGLTSLDDAYKEANKL